MQRRARVFAARGREHGREHARALTRPTRLRRAVRSERCLLGNRELCPHRVACELDALQLARARAGSRPDFDAVYERYFSRCIRAARALLCDPALEEACTRDVLRATFRTPYPAGACVAAHVWWLLLLRLRGGD